MVIDMNPNVIIKNINELKNNLEIIKKALRKAKSQESDDVFVINGLLYSTQQRIKNLQERLLSIKKHEDIMVKQQESQVNDTVTRLRNSVRGTVQDLRYDNHRNMNDYEREVEECALLNMPQRK